MRFGMVKVAAVTPTVKVNDPKANARTVAERLKKLAADGVEIAVFPELFMSGYTAADLFFTRALQNGVVEAVKYAAERTPAGMLAFVGAPLAMNGRLYNCAVAMSAGRVLGIVPKTEIPEYGEFYEKRYFSPNAFDGAIEYVPLGAPIGNVLFKCGNCKELTVAAEICEDMWTDVPPSVDACRAGATVVVNLSASDETVGKAEYRRLLVSGASGRQRCAYVYADAGAGESSTDMVFSAHNMIAENGAVIAESEPFAGGEAIADIDVERIDAERQKTGVHAATGKFVTVDFELKDTPNVKLSRKIEKYPFLPHGENADKRAELILTMQARGLKTRMDATGAKTAVIGVSGGLDSSLALLVCARAADKKKIYPVTMPAFGTTDRTKNNAEELCAALGLTLKTVDLKDTVAAHLKDIEHETKDTTYENAQARMRTVTLFDLANKTGGLVVGTGDLSELALGWATYNGDHMSSYGVNAGVPKTLVKFLVRYEAKRLGGNVERALNAVLDTDISPELLPPENGKIAQKTEDILGKYDLIDFITYYYVRFGFTRDKIKYLMDAAFSEVAEAEKVKALDTFYKRFFAAQFKRSCLPDGVKIGSVSFSPRSDFRMPSDL